MANARLLALLVISSVACSGALQLSPSHAAGVVQCTAGAVRHAVNAVQRHAASAVQRHAAGAAGVLRCRTTNRHRVVKMESESEWRRRMSERKPGWEEPPMRAQPVQRAVPLSGDFDGTRQGVARALRADRYRRQGTDADRATAETSLVDAVNTAEAMTPDEAINGLRVSISQAAAVGVDPKSSAMDRAVALLTALEAGYRFRAASSADGSTVSNGASMVEPKEDSEESVVDDEWESEEDGLASKLDALFGAGYAVEPPDGAF